MFSIEDAKAARIGTVVELAAGEYVGGIAHKHGPDKWFVAWSWDLPLTDDEIVERRARFVATTRLR